MNYWITVKTASDPSELRIAKSCLEHNGITCFLYAESVIRDAELRVEKKDAERASEILMKAGLDVDEDEEKEDKYWIGKFVTKCFGFILDLLT